MCGIAGFCDFNKKTGATVLQEMTDVLAYRGPDDSGYSLSEGAHAQVGLGHRRLSIIDLSPLGHQPMSALNGRYKIIFNGEIYNYKEIRKELEAMGHQFITHSDTEVIALSIHQWGIDSIHRFIGMFAFAIYDTVEDLLWIVRDRAGVKPLYYYWKDDLFLFGSELKAFHKHPHFEKEMNLQAVELFFELGYIPAPHSIFNHAYKLKPGHYLKIDIQKKTIKNQQYWNVLDYYNKPALAISEQEALIETERLMHSAFEYRMVADVPVGVFLSGGYDSTAVAALLQSTRSERLKTFTIGFHEDTYNEAPHAMQVAKYLGTDHTEYYCSYKEAEEMVPNLSQIFDEPFGDSSAIPTLLVSKIARKDVTVSLSADAGDELFAGYKKHLESLKYFGQRKAYPFPVGKTIAHTMNAINPGWLNALRQKKNFEADYYKIAGYWQAKNATEVMRIYSQAFPRPQLHKLLHHKISNPSTAFDNHIHLKKDIDDLSSLLAIDYSTYLADDILTKVDRATMSVSLEGREPLLDHRLVAFAATLPSSLKYKNGTQKYLLKQIVHKYVPKELMERPKMGFAVPVEQWLKTSLKELVLHHLQYERIHKQGLLNADEVIKIRDNYLNGEGGSYLQVWLLLIFQMWMTEWME